MCANTVSTAMIIGARQVDLVRAYMEATEIRTCLEGAIKRGDRRMDGRTDGGRDREKTGSGGGGVRAMSSLAVLGKMPDQLSVRRVHTYVSVVIAGSSAIFRARRIARRGQEAHYSRELRTRSTANRRKTQK